MVPPDQGWWAFGPWSLVSESGMLGCRVVHRGMGSHSASCLRVGVGVAAPRCLPGLSFLAAVLQLVEADCPPPSQSFSHSRSGIRPEKDISTKFPGNAAAAGPESILQEPTLGSQDRSDFGSFKTPGDGSGFLHEISRFLNIEIKIKY